MREKLIELLAHDDCPLFMVYGDNVEALADYLIAKGIRLEEKQAASNKASEENKRWVHVTERLPEKMEQCVCRYVFGENIEYPFYQVLWYFARDEKPHFQHECSMGLRVTHWMPLPEPPKEV